jgi:hypothetical protein
MQPPLSALSQKIVAYTLNRIELEEKLSDLELKTAERRLDLHAKILAIDAELAYFRDLELELARRDKLWIFG